VPDTETEDTGPDSAGLDEVADELYAARPDEFIPRRDEAVARAKEAGDRDLARAVGRLRRPTRAAWLSNLLARERPDQLEGLLGMAEGLAEAQRTLDGTALRQLSSQRRKLVAAVAQEAARLARAEHEPVSDQLMRELGDILEAALADPAVADEVRSGRLTRTVSYSGFGPAAQPGAAPQPGRPRPAPPRRAPAEPEPEPVVDDRAEQERQERERRAERERREQALAAAEAEEEAARDRQVAAEGAREDAVAARDDARDRVSRLAAELEAAREAERSAADAAREAETAARAAARDTGAAASRTARARAALDEL
jgi:hypothetical protein